jgi:hypothetical protein
MFIDECGLALWLLVKGVKDITEDWKEPQT